MIDQILEIRNKSHFSGQLGMDDISTPNTTVADLLLLDVCPLGLGIEDIHGHMHTLIRRNTTIPVRTQFYSIFTNAYAYQTTAIIRIFEGEQNLTKYNVSSVFKFDNLDLVVISMLEIIRRV